MLVIPLYRCAQSDPDPLAINLSGQWKIIGIDTPEVSNPDYDDSGAESITIPGNWNHILEKNNDYAATVWLRKRVFIGRDADHETMVLSLGMIPLSDEAYFNGVFIGGMGDIPDHKESDGRSHAWLYSRNYIVPASVIRYGSENVISIRIFSQIINGIKDEPMLTTYNNWNNSYKFINEVMPLGLKIVSIIILFVLAIFLLTLIVGNRKVKLIIYSLLFMMTGFFLSLISQGILLSNNTFLRIKIGLTAYLIVDFLLLLMIKEFFNFKLRWGITILAGVLIISGVLLLSAQNGLVFVTYFIPMLVVVLVSIVLTMTALFLIALIRDPRRYWYLSFIVIASGIVFYYNVHKLITLQLYAIRFSQHYVFPFFFVCAMAIYINDLKNVKIERDDIARKLLQKSQKLKKLVSRLENRQDKTDPAEAIYRLINYLDENYYETYDRRHLADKFEINEDYMGQIFRKITGTNITNYINDKRIEASKQLIIETDTKIIDIAFQVGFENLTYFYRLFKQQTGMAPNEFRNVMQNKETYEDDKEYARTLI